VPTQKIFLLAKALTSPSSHSPSIRQSRRGIALISVLAMVMLLTVLMVAFMMRAGSERQAAGYYNAEATTRELSDTTLNLVEGLINEGTYQTGAAGVYYSWASQPGSIRVFDQTGAAYKTFKLYSASSMVGATTTSALVKTFLSGDDPSNTTTNITATPWYSYPGIWVDLNAPVNTDPNPNAAGLGDPAFTHFPILDPRDPTDLTKLLFAADGQTAILPKMDGFFITNAPTDTTTKVDANTAFSYNPAPMPVQWLYVLRDGSMTTPDYNSGTNGLYTFTSPDPKTGRAKPVPGTTNPIVGRVAFWTDDETSKININTAAADGLMQSVADTGGVFPTGHYRVDPKAIADATFWSPPYFAAIDDIGPTTSTGFLCGFATGQPVSGEYQRYPGHPATVALSNIFNSLGVSLAFNRGDQNTAGAQAYQTTVAGMTSTPLYSDATSVPSVPGVTPRYAFGGTRENVVNSYYNNTANETAYALQTGIGTIQATSTPTAAFRLYPTLSETLFNPDATRSRTPLNSATPTARQRMEAGRFFLTAHSRAPELNLYGLPRVSIWPLSSVGTSAYTAVDKLIAFCTTIGGGSPGATGSYSFTRVTPTGSCDSTVDIGIQRNRDILSYLDYVTKQNIPGFGGSFSAKNYGTNAAPLISENDQILAEIFDYIRTTNLGDITAGTYYGGSWQSSNYGNGQAVPSLLTPAVMGSHWTTTTNTTQGNSSYPRLVEVTLQFIAMGRGGTGNTPSTWAIPVNPSEVLYSTIAGGYASLFGAGDSGVTTFYNHPVSGNPTVTQPYAVPGATGAFTGPPIASSSKVSVVSNGNTGLMSGIPPDGTTAIQAFLMLTFVNPAQDWFDCNPCVWVSISGLSTFKIGQAAGTYALNFPDPDCMIFASSGDWQGGGHSGYYPPQGNFNTKGYAFAVDPNKGWYGLHRVGVALNGSAASTAGTNGESALNGFPFFSQIIPIKTSGRFAFTGGTVKIRLYDSPPGGTPVPTSITVPSPDGGTDKASPTGGHWIQTYTVNFPVAAQSVVQPTIPLNPNSLDLPPADPNSADPPAASPVVYPTLPVTNYYPPPNNNSSDRGYWAYQPYVTPKIAYGTYNASAHSWVANFYEETGPIVGLYNPPGSLPPNDNNLTTSPFPDPPGPKGVTGGTPYQRWNAAGQAIPFPLANYIGTGDVVQSMVLTPTWSDPRVLATRMVPAAAFTTHPNWSTRPFAHNMYAGMVVPAVGNGTTFGGNAWTSAATHNSIGSLAGNQVDPCLAFAYPNLGGCWPWAPCNSGGGTANTSDLNDNTPPPTSTGLRQPLGFPPDWDNGLSTGSDGPWTNKADEGSGLYLNGNGISPPYYGNLVPRNGLLFSANREVCSPGMFGSLPTGVDPAGLHPAPWQTLLFRPGPGAAAALSGVSMANITNGVAASAGGVEAHPGEGTLAASATAYGPPYLTPPDHLWMDLFWIPVAEPYPISEPMSTAGKVNINYQILPFTYIKRATALRAALATEKVAQVSLAQGGTARGGGGTLGLVLNATPLVNATYTNDLTKQVPARYPIDLDTTITQFDAKFKNYDVFRSASQICEAFLVPMDIPNLLGANTFSAAAVPGLNYEKITPAGNYALPTSIGDTTGVANFARDWYVPVTSTATASPFAMVGDNLREQPYAHLYGKLTTKSNTFTVYYRVQALKNPPSVDPAKWSEPQGAVTGEYRGSTTIERFIDPNEKTVAGVAAIPDAVSEVKAGTAPTSLEKYYKWRVVENHQFAP
jgi:uncharacterized protein (TIGR02600 family)